MKIKELAEKCREIINRTPEFDYKCALNTKKENIGIIFSSIEAGIHSSKVWCPGCGCVNGRKTLASSGWYDCPSCFKRLHLSYGNDLIEYTKSAARVIHVDEEFVLIESIPPVRSRWTNEDDTEEDPKKIWESMEVSFKDKEDSRYYIISKENGVRYMPSLKSMPKTIEKAGVYRCNFIETEYHKEYISFMKSLGSSKGTYGEDLKSDIDYAISVLSSSKTASTTKKPSKSALKGEAEDEVARKLVKEDGLSASLSAAKGLKYAYRYSNSEYLYWCGDCGHYEEKVLSEVEKKSNRLICSCCGKEIPTSVSVASAVSSQETKKFADIVADDEGNVVFNLYRVKFAFDTSDSKFKKTSSMYGKVLFTKDGKEITYDDKGNRTVSGGCYSFSDVMSLRGEDDDITTITNSFWGKMGLDIVYKNCVKSKSPVLTGIVAFITNMKKVPIIEQLVKCSCFNLYKWVLHNNNNVKIFDHKAPNIRESFGLTKSQTKVVIENDFTFVEMAHLKALQKADPSCTFEEYNWSFTTYPCSSMGTNDVLLSVEKTGATVSAVIQYLSSCYYDQCIDWPEITSLWLDYLDMMDTLNFSPAEKKKEMFPTSLKKAHDILNFAVKNILDKEKAKIFDENVAEAKKFEYSFEDYLIKAPDSAEDLVKEGVALNHSVGQHIRYVADGKEYILFIREKSNPDKPLYTVELLKTDKAIVQVRGNSNKLVRDPVVLNFIQKWAKYKKLTIKAY